MVGTIRLSGKAGFSEVVAIADRSVQRPDLLPVSVGDDVCIVLLRPANFRLPFEFPWGDLPARDDFK